MHMKATMIEAPTGTPWSKVKMGSGQASFQFVVMLLKEEGGWLRGLELQRCLLN